MEIYYSFGENAAFALPAVIGSHLRILLFLLKRFFLIYLFVFHFYLLFALLHFSSLFIQRSLPLLPFLCTIFILQALAINNLCETLW